MKITSVSFKKLVSTDNYSNVQVGAEALVSEGESPEDAFTNVAYWVTERLRQMKINVEDSHQIQMECDQLQNRKENLELELARLRRVKNSVMEMLEKHGVNTEAIKSDFDSIPF